MPWWQLVRGYADAAGEQNGQDHGEEEHNRKSEEKSRQGGEVGRRHSPRHRRPGDSRGGRCSRRRGVDAHCPGIAGRREIGGGGGAVAPIAPAASGKACEGGEDARESQDGDRQAGEEESGAPAFVALTPANLHPSRPRFARMVNLDHLPRSSVARPHVYLPPFPCLLLLFPLFGFSDHVTALEDVMTFLRIVIAL
jgi:hypothetical protein